VRTQGAIEESLFDESSDKARARSVAVRANNIDALSLSQEELMHLGFVTPSQVGEG